MPIQFLALIAGAALAVGMPLRAQTAPATRPVSLAPGNVLTLADAITLARRNNPVYASAANARRTAASNVRAANGAFLPDVNTSFSSGYREGRPSLFQGQQFGSTNDQLSTGVSANAQLSLSLAEINNRRVARANADATEADIIVAEQRVRTDVTTQYLAALQAQARAVLQDTLLVTTQAQLQLARARLQVGSGTQLDVQRAEVADGRQRVAQLNARNTAAIEIVRLFQQIGIDPVPGTTLDPTLPPTPTIELSSLLEQSLRSNPAIDALQARDEAARRSVAAARASYYPALGIQAGVSGFTNRFTDTELLIANGMSGMASQRASCIRSEEVRNALGLPNRLGECDAIAFTPVQEQLIRSSQSKYPFSFTRNPYDISASLSLPLFNGWRREQQIEQASVQRNNVQNDLRAQQLRVTADVTAATLSLTTAQQTVSLQEQNVRTARTALALAQERYRVGAISLVELLQARGDFELAETDRITAVYDVQRAFAALEAAVGRPLR